MPVPPCPPDIQATLLDVASASLAHGLRAGKPLDVRPASYPEIVRREAACFVTLRIGAALRGCIGSVQARFPLVADVSANAYSAGFRDPRFSPITPAEFGSLSVSISILADPEPVSVNSEPELLELMHPRSHGWILELGKRRGLLLPAVWEAIDDPREFLEHLKAKAQIKPDAWSNEIVVKRFGAQSFGPNSDF